VDTTRESDARAALDLVKGIAGPAVSPADLAWTRLTRWRNAVATALLSGACKKRVEAIDEIEIGWAGAGAPTTAIYLASWLRGVFPGARIRLAMCDPSRPESSRIRRVRLAGKGTEIVLERPSGTGVTVSMDGLQMAAVFPALDEVELLGEELSILGRDAVFEETLGGTGEILKMVEE
jgi:glucose-6-phosphate dehydrogenase assembly protein OpcA